MLRDVLQFIIHHSEFIIFIRPVHFSVRPATKPSSDMCINEIIFLTRFLLLHSIMLPACRWQVLAVGQDPGRAENAYS